MHKQRLIAGERRGQPVQKAAVAVGHRRQRISMHRGQRPVTGVAHAVRHQCRGTADLGVQIAKITAQPVILGLGVIQKQAEHPVMVALQNHPVFPARLPLAQMLDHARAVGATVDQIADMNHRCRAVAGDVGGNQAMRGLQQGKMAVDVTDGVGVHGGQFPEAGLGVARRAGGQPPAPPGYLRQDESARSGHLESQRLDLAEHAGAFQRFDHPGVDLLV